MCTSNTINRLSAATFAPPITTIPERSADAHEIVDRLRLRFVQQQQAHLDELFREGDLDHALRTLAAQVNADVQIERFCRFSFCPLRDFRCAA